MVQKHLIMKMMSHMKMLMIHLKEMAILLEIQLTP
jgi:hypothetical protein